MDGQSGTFRLYSQFTDTAQVGPFELDAGQIERLSRALPGGAQNIQDIYPLTPMQEEILSHHILDEQSDAQSDSALCEFQSRSLLDAFVEALQWVIGRHDALRMAVMWEQLPRAVQLVCRQAALRAEHRTLDPDRSATEQLKGWMRPARQKWNLRCAPLMRFEVAVHPRSGRWHALLQVHRLVCDSQSLDVLLSEVMHRLSGRANGMPEPIPYCSHVAHALDRTRTHDAEAYFRTKLGDVDEPTAPFGLSGVPEHSEQGEEAHQVLEEGLTRRIRALTRHTGVCAATLFHVAWSLVVARTSGRDDVVFGTVLGRLRETKSSRRILGTFLNTLPLRLKLQGQSAQELLEQTQHELVELLSNEHASLAMARRSSGLHGSAPLFTTLLDYRHTASDTESKWTDTEGITVQAIHGRRDYPVVLSVDDLRKGFALKIETDRRIDPYRMLGYVRTAIQSLLQALEEASQTPALSLSIMPESELRQVVEIFNTTEVSCLQDKLIHQLFEEQVERTPNAVAVVFQGQSLTYAELNKKANQLARSLRTKGVGPDQLVGICVERSLEMVIGLVGILKAGGAYVPLDPNYPAERLGYMVATASPKVLLTQQRLKDRLPATTAAVISLDSDRSQITCHLTENIPAATLGLCARHLVYVIYTSGSTGRPKATAMAHRSMVNLIEWHRRNFKPSQGKPVLQFAALSFDVAFQEVFSTLCTGNTLTLLDEWVRRDPPALTELLRDHSIERLFLPPLMLQSLAEFLKTTNALPMALRDIVVAGEKLRISSQIQSLFKRLSGCRLHNHYGPTETHVVTALTLPIDTGNWPTFPEIGQPIANTQIYLLDGYLQPVPIEVPGEIYIAGAGVARGYLNQPELTAERFVSDLFGPDPGARMYKTGDLGRWNASGNIECLGRNDDQIKIRGFRVELGEIEAQLVQHPQVKEAAVLARESVPGQKRLVAYIVPFGDDTPTADELRARLKAVLPEHMVPSSFVMLATLPLTPNGKLDQRALPIPDPGPHSKRKHEPLQGTIEEGLAAIWQELLLIGLVSRDDNFFELGGNSLLGMKLLARIAEVYNRRLAAGAIFRYPTLQKMAERVEESLSDHITMLMRPSPRRPTDPVPLTFHQQFFRSALAQGQKQSRRSVFTAVRISGQLNIDSLRRGLAEIVRRHEALRTRIVSLDGIEQQHIDEQGDYTLDIVELKEELLEHREATAARLVEQLVLEPIDISAGPLFVAKLLKLGDRDHVLAIAIDHLVSDNISMGILQHDLWTVYAERVHGLRASLPKVPIQFSDFAVWQQQTHQSWMDMHGSYWRERLRGARRVCLPADEELPRDTRIQVAVLPISLGGSLSAALRDLSSAATTTMELSVLSIFAAVLLRWCEKKDLVLSFVTTGRLHPEVEATVGNFATHLLLRPELHDHDSFLSFTRRITEEYGMACEHDDSGKWTAAVPTRGLASNFIFNWSPQEVCLHPTALTPFVGSAQVEALGDDLQLQPFSVDINWPKDLGELGDPECISELHLFLSDTDAEVAGGVEYRTDHLTVGMAKRFERNFRFFTETLIRTPDIRLAALDFAQ